MTKFWIFFLKRCTIEIQYDGTVLVVHFDYRKNYYSKSIGKLLGNFCRAFHGTSFKKKIQNFIIFLSWDICEIQYVLIIIPHPIFIGLEKKNENGYEMKN